METINLVQNDVRPAVRLVLRDKKNGNPLDVSAPTTTLVFRLRAVGGSALKESISMTKPNGGSDGIVEIPWTPTSLNTPGDFEGEIGLSFNGEAHTVYDLVPIHVRPEFG